MHMAYSQPVTQANFEDVKAVVVATLDIEDRADDLVPESRLLGSLPELDSLAVVELLTALQDRFGIEIEDDEVISDIFETLGQLTAFIDAKVRSSAPLRGGVR
jgi:acyl carrier protein